MIIQFRSSRTCCVAVRLVLAGMMLFGTMPAAAQEVSGLQAAVAIEQAMVDAIAKAEKSVVAIARVRKPDAPVTVGENSPRDFDPNRLLRRFGGEDNSPTNPDWVPSEFSTGVVVDAAGFIVTNFHVLGDPRANDYYVWIQRRPFKVVEVRQVEAVQAGDPWTDLAVLKIDAQDLTPIALGDAKSLKKGQLVISLGNPYAIARDGDVSASWGIISNLSRKPPAAATDPPGDGELNKESLHHYGTLIQTDARLNLGTSGGALINLHGEMIGLTTALAALDGYEKSAGFAIPVDDVFRRTVETLKTGHKAEFGFLGVGPENLAVELRRAGWVGVQVAQVVPGTPAASAGLESGDIITHIDGVAVNDRNMLMRELGRQAVGATIQITIERGSGSGRHGKILQRPAKLTKKYIASARPAFSQIGDRVWRGLTVDFATAVPQALANQANELLDPRGCVAAAQVETNSPAWKSGLRPGTMITHVGSRRVVSPDEFFAAVEGRSGDVELTLSNGSELTVSQPPATP